MAAIPTLSSDFTKTYAHELSKEEKRGQEALWQLEKTQAFDELILSWNGLRPEKGKWTFWTSLFVGEWSPWIRYAEWGRELQKTFKHAPQGCKVESYQDAVYPKEGLCEAFRVKVTAEEGASLNSFDSFFACLSNLSGRLDAASLESLPSVFLSNVPRRSQLTLNHPRFSDLCSPTASSTAINYLLGLSKVDPISFAEKVHDKEFDIYGNWILNTAQAYQELGGNFHCRAERLASFSSLHSYLARGLPVIVSIRGPLVGSYRPMTFGHLVCVTGFDAKSQKVHCIDSGFPKDEQTAVTYPLKDFLEAWARRQNIAYLFTPKNLESALRHKIMQT